MTSLTQVPRTGVTSLMMRGEHVSLSPVGWFGLWCWRRVCCVVVLVSAFGSFRSRIGCKDCHYRNDARSTDQKKIWNLLRINEIGQQDWPTNSNRLEFFLFMYIHPHSSTSLLLYMLTSCSGVRAVLWDFTIALALHTCVYLYIFALWRRCSPAGFHQSSCTDESACSLLPNECLRMVFWPCSMFL